MTRRALPVALDRHREALASCRRCGHADARVVPILSSARSPRVVLVGQAPGQVELGDRRPFAGRAGRTLFRWLERTGIDETTARDAIYIAAVTRCYPGPSPTGRGDRVPSPDERATCAPWLDAELRLIRPRLLIPVGRLAIDRFLGPGGALADLVGRRFDVSHAGGRCEAVPLPHPSGASSWPNQPGNRERLDRALALLAERFDELGMGGVRRPRRTA
ncbi:MAG TPA: uracil-DNA glycosylase family protein [Gemmatimonadaceae bacterium]|nr:uracil-DNA glycosylase family protein [Gemmatimonadaceae bacterium]